MSEEDNDLSINNTTSEEELDNDSTLDEPATPLLTNQTLPDVTNQLDNLHLNIGDNQRRRNPTLAPTAERITVSNRSFKVNSLTEFSG
jgi:hypothetical protein